MSENESTPRKASEVILELEAQVKSLVSLVKSHDLNMRLLSNKINLVLEKLDKQPIAAHIQPQPTFSAEVAVAQTPPAFMPPPTDVKEIPIQSDYKLPSTDAPIGFRRTSRPETYQSDTVYQPKPNTPMEQVKFPTAPNGPKPPPGRIANEVIVPPKATEKIVPPTHTPAPSGRPETIAIQPPLNTNAVPVQQRVVNKDNKTVFLADVEITDHLTAQSVYKGRTSGNGKWMASLVPGNYRITIIKRESITKEKVEVVQDIVVDGSKSPLELPTVIIK